MKNLSLILNVILLVAVGVLFYLHFSTHRSTRLTPNNPGSHEFGNSAVAYIVEDTLLNHLDLFTDLTAQLNKKRQTMENAYASRAQALQTEIDNYKQTSGNMTINQARATEDELMRKQQNLSQYQEALNQDLMNEQAKINDQLYDHVATYLKENASSMGYQVVLNLKRGAGMLYGSDTLDITYKVLEGLNAKYKKEKDAASGKTAKPDTLKKGK